MPKCDFNKVAVVLFFQCSFYQLLVCFCLFWQWVVIDERSFVQVQRCWMTLLFFSPVILAAIRSNLFNQDNISSPFATANIEACIFAIGLISWTNCLSAILLLWELWGLTNSVLTPQCYPLLLFLKIWFLQVRPCLSLCLYWDVLLSVFYYTLY